MPPTDAPDPPDPPASPSGIAVPIGIPPAIARIRDRWDRAARDGARPHVTVLYPFLPSPALTASVRAALVGIAATVEPFDLRFERVRRFDDGVVWLEPDPTEPFAALTAAVARRWPAYPPYGGMFDEVIVHLTVVEARTRDAPLGDIEHETSRHLPFTARAERLEVWRQDADGRWHPHWRIPLGRGPALRQR
ncbi:MAG TPA: 2'-5' RNA ligase family protein [Candidatus Limnocylindrales bacterium]